MWKDCGCHCFDGRNQIVDPENAGFAARVLFPFLKSISVAFFYTLKALRWTNIVKSVKIRNS